MDFADVFLTSSETLSLKKSVDFTLCLSEKYLCFLLSMASGQKRDSCGHMIAAFFLKIRMSCWFG